MIQFRINGRAISQGSKNPVVPKYKDGTPVKRHSEDCAFYGLKGQPEYNCKCNVMVNVIEDNAAELEGWRTQVGMQGRKAMKGAEPIDGCIEAEFVFFLPRPAGHYGSGKNSNVLRAAAPARPNVKPDGLKLARAIEDALSSIVYVDDARLVEEHVSKRYVHRWEDPYVLVRVWPSECQTAGDLMEAGIVPRPLEAEGQLGLVPAGA